MSSASPALEVEELTVTFPAFPRLSGAAGDLAVVDKVSLSLSAGGALGLVGESASGKTMIALAVMRLLPGHGRIASGRVRWKGQDLSSLDERALQRIRGREIAMVFQDATAALNPTLTVGEQLVEAVVLHQHLGQAAARQMAIELLGRAGIASPELRLDDHPHAFSRGMRQRALLAQALAGDPKLLIVDEPTASIDAIKKWEMVDLLGGLRRERGMGLIVISHDLSVVARACDEVAVMYAGRVVERGPRKVVFDTPRHPYTVALLASTKWPPHRAPLVAIAGSLPLPGHLPSGCRFRDRCPRAQDRCAEEPTLVRLEENLVACWFPEDGSA